jgi:hypothetical protein
MYDLETVVLKEQHISVKYCFRLGKSKSEKWETKLGFSVKMQKPNGGAVGREVCHVHVQ